MKRRTRQLVVLGLVIVVGLAALLTKRALEPTGTPEGYLRVDHQSPLAEVLQTAQTKGFVRSSQVPSFIAGLMGRSKVSVGTYKLSGKVDGLENARRLFRPIGQMVRIPETNWAKRTANILEKKEVCTAEEYLAEVNHPQGRKTEFPLPEDTLEGYLYPDTYDLPPLMGAKSVVGRQLEAFRRKVWEPLGKPKDLHHILILASLVQLEAGPDIDKPIIAGVIENRLKKKMRLQIDAALLYGMGKWRRLTFKDYKEFDSPYNLYTHGGLPPTPICSPSIASIRAAMNPASHNYLYYVALPNGRSIYAATYEEHKKNIEKRKEALKQAAKP